MTRLECMRRGGGEEYDKHHLLPPFESMFTPGTGD